MLRFSPCFPCTSLFGIVFCLLSIAAGAAFLKGNGSLTGFDTDGDVSFSNILNHLDFALMGDVKVTNCKWAVVTGARSK
ncbi:hypothetical protein J2W42_001942 [Rhizobium tibeticum]|uniref:hypothetical protein n=1 Tax=Rhizobium tibeticum TaxID=501024 RepID=UPI002783EDFD|nr:hypothetical protein [Rhizobium tibeticum]MDP9809095.1 hypothetical protein [Rhizobium tibeticum]